MDEMSKLREWRDDAPTPDRTRLAPGRRRLLDAAGARKRRRLPGLGDWRVVSGAVAAGVTAVALLSTGVGGGTGTPAADGGAQLARPLEPQARASDLLLKAATVVAADPVPKPESGEWVYVREVRVGVSEPDDPSPNVMEDWIEYADPEFEDWNEGDDHSPREGFEYLAALPDDTDAVLQKARWFYPEDGERPDTEDPGAGRSETELAAWNFGSLGLLAGTAPHHPGGQARVYQAMATIPGLRVADTTVTDPAGRRALAFYLGDEVDTGDGPYRDELLLDPETYTYLGTRYVATEDTEQSQYGPAAEEGEVVAGTAVLSTALVDDDGERP
ncbi:CU044_5270 family protein [Streptomyces phytophilus]|uniref:CU044_5270 family protein n=1 Tax=Streptomyces phytophilus TaxID=722715 RepID=UPI00215D9EFE|nr:CU044_5270 family protein [Streptomyces phytophilus]